MATHSVLSPGKSHGQRNLVSDSLWGYKKVGYDLVTEPQQCLSESLSTEHLALCSFLFSFLRG